MLFLYRRLFILLCLSILLIGSPSTEAASEEFSYTQLKALIQNRQVTSLTDLLTRHVDAFPASLRSRYLLVHRSGSLQFGSPAEPRIILFTDDAHFIMAVTGSQSEAGHDSIEVIQFDEQSDSFTFNQILFPSTANGSVSFQDGETEPRPVFCRNCHGQPSRPNWQPYNLWPGVYGSVDDKIAPTTLEGRRYANFLATQSGQGRYAILQNLPSRAGDGFNDKNFFYLSRSDRVYDNINSDEWSPRSDRRRVYRDYPRANYKFTSEVGRLNIRRIARQMLNDPDFPRLRQGIAAALLNCRDPAVFMPPRPEGSANIRLSDFLKQAQANVDGFGQRLLADTFTDLDWPIDTCGPHPRPPLPNMAEDINRNDACRFQSLHNNEADITAKLAYVYAWIDKTIDLRNLSLVHTYPGYKFSIGNVSLQWLRQALAEMGDLRTDPLYQPQGSIGADVLRRCNGP